MGGEKVMEVLDLPLKKLVPSRNLRTEGVDVQELVQSIREHGLLQPIRVRPIGSGTYQIIAGHRRVLAHRELGRSTISAVVVKETDESAAAQGIVENLQREDLRPLELAHGVRELATAFGLAPEKIAQAMSKSPAQVRTWMRLSRLPDDVLSKLESGEGRTQAVTGLSPRLIQPFVSNMPSEEEVARDPEAAARFEDTVSTVTRFQEEIEERQARINAHMADEVARRTRSGQVTVTEAIDEVLANPEKYRYAKPPISSGADLEQDTWAAYKRIHQEISALIHTLRPEIASSFSPSQKRDLLDRLHSQFESLRPYAAALQGDGVTEESAVPKLGAGKTRRS